MASSRRISPLKSGPLTEKSRNMPSYFVRDDIVRAVAENKVTVISGGTGCGMPGDSGGSATVNLPNK